jgi:hypothetical protein
MEYDWMENSQKDKALSVDRERQLYIEFDGSVRSSYGMGLDHENGCHPEPANYHKLQEGYFYANRPGHFKLLADAIIAYLEWSEWRTNQKREQRQRAIAKANRTRRARKTDVQEDNGLVDVPPEE